jgi:tetratricopeptide (TPR) repeat protein
MDTAKAPELPSATSGRSGRWLALGVGCLLVIGLGWYGWRWHAAPQPPPVFDLGADGDPRLVQAVEEARQQVVSAPRSAAAWGRLGQVLLAHAYVVEAKPCLVQAEALDPTDPRWPYLQGWGDLLNHPEDAAAGFTRAVARANEDVRLETARLRLAQTLLDRREFDAAGEQFRALLNGTHATALAHLGLGSIALDTGDLDHAVMHLEIAAGSPLCRKRAGSQLAAAYRRRGNPALADQWERRALSVRKDEEWPDPFLRESEDLVVGKTMRMLRAENLLRDGQRQEAAVQFRRIIDDYPDDTQSRVKLAMALMDLHRYQDAEDVLHELLQIDRRMVQGHFLLSAVLFQQAERHAKHPAESKEARLRFQEAAEQARQALALQPTHGFAFIYLGLALRHLGQLDEAVQALENAVRCNPEAVDPHLHLGETLVLVNRRSDAIRQLRDAERVAPPTDLRPQEALKRLLAP